MGFFDKAIPKDVDVKQSQNVVNNPVMYKDENPDIYILLERQYSKEYIKKYVQLLKSETPELRVCVMGVLNIQPKRIKGSITKFYTENKIDISSYIPPFSKVIADRRTILALNESDTIDVEGFYDIIFNNTYFYNPQYKMTIFPVDPIVYWLNRDNSGRIKLKDTWQRFFHLYQVKKAYNTTAYKYRHKKVYIVEPEDPNEFLRDWMDYDKEVAWDIETKFLNPWNPESRILEITMSFDGVTGYYLPWDKIDVELLSQFLKNKKQILQNGKYDAKFLILNGVDRDSIHIYHDTWNGSHVINEMQRSGLKSDAWLYTDMGGYDNDLDKYLKKYPSAKNDYSKIPKSIRKPYAVKDAIVTYRHYQAQREKLFEIGNKLLAKDEVSWNTLDYFYKSVMPSVNLFLDVELEGMIVDWEILQQKSKELDESIKNAKAEIWKVFDVPKNTISIDSGQELGIFLEALGWPLIERGKEKPKKEVINKIISSLDNPSKVKAHEEGVYLTGEDPLGKWKRMGYEREVDAILHYRELTTLMKTFVGYEKDDSGFFQYRKNDNRIHSTFGPMLTHSHRNWSKNPNLQNIIKHGERAKWFREIFSVPDEEYYLAEPDGKNLQGMIGAILSNDQKMKDIFVNNNDWHSATAVNTFMLNTNIHKVQLNDHLILTEFDKVKVIRGEKEIEIYAIEIKEGDDLIDY